MKELTSHDWKHAFRNNKTSPQIVLLALDENSIATFHDRRANTYFESSMLSNVGKTMNEDRHSVDKAEALRRTREYAKLIEDQTAYVGFKVRARISARFEPHVRPPSPCTRSPDLRRLKCPSCSALWFIYVPLVLVLSWLMSREDLT